MLIMPNYPAISILREGELRPFAEEEACKDRVQGLRFLAGPGGWWARGAPVVQVGAGKRGHPQLCDHQHWPVLVLLLLLSR